MNVQLYLCAGLSFLISVIITPILIPLLKRMKVRQVIREVGPKWHKGKGGTPAMGGIAFLISTLVISLIFCKQPEVRAGIVAVTCFGLIGFLDDFIKIALKRNLGLNEKQKLILQILVSVVFLIYCVNKGFVRTQLSVPFTNLTFELSWFYIVFAGVFMVGFVNAVNLTDGLDGLAASVTILVTAFFAVASAMMGRDELSYFSASITGGLIGFLIYNYNPAKIFMGDTGSLFLGGAVSVIAILNKMELLLLLVGIIYLVEALSVMIQVSYFKLTGKRVFLMAPIHHHFEMKGLWETKIVFLFSLITLIACIIAIFAIL